MSFGILPSRGGSSVSIRSPRKSQLPGADVCHRRRIPAAGRRPVWPKGLRASCAACGPRAAVEEGGAVGEWRRTGSMYELLGIPMSGSLDEIKRAYKQLARKYHPDVSPPNLAQEYTRRFIEVQEAYETLSDPSRRAIYDRHLVRGIHFAFSARKKFDEEVEERSGWKRCWQDQLEGLKRRSMNKNPDDDDDNDDLSWGARMRRRREESSSSVPS
ncbi:Chaperone protein dnaJ 20, chloroplastic [Apostasia shenzhenica]|uniref:Chaperone protein dnaJ 20, chloroplastic n=1 Tax=Apostasia shenzhenica TaxID=1088818 RepID=A0A2I0B0F0_9ASPA|nr:Chaperone protein dnaJ 20, chloroplastic [Apostasia shenzhenica]